ncbi:MAG: hypothetical protein HZC24_10995 [Rhodocyclales bacterium]|nr:hypothetical protein [Rhodocyclales bacterium]
MKKLSVTIRLELEIPDEWALHSTSEGTDVLRIGQGQYMDLTFEPMLTKDPEGTWSNSADDEFMNALMDMVVAEDVAYEISTVQ